ncbi:retinaldehyde-binding protein 1-like [Malaya genurostris]|uniref:retinaldehyde-binding protein 1-like n=1 Tax=Malaya genurostris TaxID=325434 RepID=UPI0026F3D747|nr:retinaldehyde-binding protein 1-like [Malaya genurostris]
MATDLSVNKCPEQYDTYNFSLPERYRKIAQDDLGETDEIREQSLAIMRDWIAKHPSIKTCRTDALFLLRFLRMRKFSIPRAQETLERYLAMRQTFPQWFQNLDPQDETMRELIDGNQFQILGQDSSGRTVILVQLKNFNPDRFTSTQQTRHMMLPLEITFDDEKTQIGGYVIILDYADFTMHHLAVWSLTDIKNIMDCVNHSLPIRMREVHAIRVPRFAVTVAELAMTCLSTKLRKRIFCHKSMMEAKKHLDESLLTTDYEGGIQDPQELKRKLIESVTEKRHQLLQLDGMEIDATKYRSMWHQTSDEDIESGVTGSFRKLTVD